LFRHAGLELVRGSLSERERDDSRRIRAVSHQLREPLSNHLGLARASGRDDLQVRTAVQHGRMRVAFELRCS